MRCPTVTQAIVLRTWPFGESDKIISFFTQGHGKVMGIAKGAKRSRKRFVNTLEPFALVSLRFQDRPSSSLALVHACDLIRPFKDLTASLEKIALASYLVEITDELTREREENRSLFEHLRKGLSFVEEQGSSLSFVTFFELRLLKLSGYQPVLDRCCRCGQRQKTVPGAQWRFSPRDGGLLCLPCSTLRKEALPLSVETLDVLASLQREDDFPLVRLSPSPSALQEARSILPCFIQYQIHKGLKSVTFLNMFPLA